MLFGSDGIFRIYFDNYNLTQQVCSTALIFIMFYGGFGTSWDTAKPVAIKAILLSTLGVVITAVLLGLFCYKAFNLSLLEGLLIGAVIGSTDAASVFAILRSKSLNLKGGLASLLEIELVHFFDGITWLMQVIIFFILGLLSYPSQLPSILINAIIIVIFLTFISRPIAIFLILNWFKVPFKQQLFLSFAGLRGAASIVFAIYAMTTDVNLDIDLFHIVFCVSLFSVAFQGTLLPKVAKVLNLIDENAPSLKTFTDYQDNTNIKLVELPILEGNLWIEKPINQINLSSNILIVMIKRNNNIIIPKGNTIIKKNDILVLNGLESTKLQKLLL